jgi:60 kDa SS-A/Ro ribonucleoprotein
MKGVVMTTTYTKHLAGHISPPQSVPLDSDQVLNSAGGYVYEVDSFARLRRFLILGSEGGTYYANERDATIDNIKCVEECIKVDGARTVNEIVEISVAGRAPKNDPAILALALCVAQGDEATKQLALGNLSKVCRIGTHLFTFVEFLNKLGTLTGRAKRRALADWYNDKEVDQAAYQAVKYRQRNGWSHRDVLRIAHPKAVDAEHAALFQWITKGTEDHPYQLPSIVTGYELAQKAVIIDQTVKVIRDYNLPREALKTEHLTSPEVWQALLDTGMGLTALIRNLGNMTRIGLLTATSDATKEVVRCLKDAEEIKKSRVHPMTILFALHTYASGGGWRSSKTWTPVTKVIDALDGAFYLAFGNVEPTNKNILLALDVSGSMGSPMGETSLTCRDASAAMALVTLAVEPNVEVVGFTSGSSRSQWSGYGAAITPLNISARQRLDDAVRTISNIPFGGTDCSLPVTWAQESGRKIDTFVTYTDSETWAGNIHPSQALKDYRRVSGIDAKLVVVGMVSNGFSIADPKDRGMLDVVGFDTSTPQIISDFSLGRI